MVQLGEMPPEEEKQPSESEKKILKQWLDSQLTGKAAEALAEKATASVEVALAEEATPAVEAAAEEAPDAEGGQEAPAS